MTETAGTVVAAAETDAEKIITKVETEAKTVFGAIVNRFKSLGTVTKSGAVVAVLLEVEKVGAEIKAKSKELADLKAIPTAAADEVKKLEEDLAADKAALEAHLKTWIEAL